MVHRNTTTTTTTPPLPLPLLLWLFPVTGGHSKQDPRDTQKTTYFPIFTNNIWSYLLRSPVTAQCTVWYEKVRPAKNENKKKRRGDENDEAALSIGILLILVLLPEGRNPAKKNKTMVRSPPAF